MGKAKRRDTKNAALNALDQGAIEKARKILEGLVANNPPDPDVLNNLAAVYEKLKIHARQSIELLEKAHQLFPTHTIVKTNLARLCFHTASSCIQEKNYTDAIPLLERTIQLDPQHLLAQLEAGNCLHMVGELEKAIAHFTKVINLDPLFVGGYTGLGLTLMEMGKLIEAKGAFQQVLALQPQKVSGYVHLGLLANRTGLTGVAVNMMQRALEIEPNNSAALNNLGLVLRDQGEITTAFDYYSKAKELYPIHPEIASGFLLTLNYLPQYPLEDIFREHCRIEQIYPEKPRNIPIRNPNPQRKLHIAYLSPDFLFHSVAYFMVGLLKEHNRDEVTVTCYFTGKSSDQLTEQIKANSDHFISCYRWSDEQLANQIQQDGVDVLIELTGHTRDHRLSMLRNRVTPVQATYLGYPNTTGLSSIDLRITDAIADPPGISDPFYSESLVRIEGGFLSYTPPQNAWKLNVGPLPALSRPGISFGSFNNLAKVNNQVLEVWAQILHRLPQATLIIKARGMRDERVLQRLKNHLYSAKIDDSRVTLKSYELFYEEHMSCYREVDLALDTFPYAGTTTTCEALWMGVPVLTLAGDRHAGRVGESILSHIGLEAFITHSPEEYIEQAVRWASDLPQLSELRLNMRERMQKSPLMDHQRMARHLEGAYRAAWKKYCDSLRTL